MTTNNDSSEASEVMVSINQVHNKAEVYYSFKGMCEKLGVSLSTGNRWKKEDKLPLAVMVNGLARFRDSDIENMVLKQNPESLVGNLGPNAAQLIKGLK